MDNPQQLLYYNSDKQYKRNTKRLLISCLLDLYRVQYAI